MVKVPNVKFNNRLEIPIFGLGTWLSAPGAVGQAIKYAIDLGYRHFDCAYVYKNEYEIGKAIADKIAEGVVKREDLFITNKLWNTYHEPGAVEPALKRSLNNLGLKYLDLYLMQWPVGFKEGKDLFPFSPNGLDLEYSDRDYVDTWKAMEEVNKKGLAKCIGVSNFNRSQIERILENATVVPATNQVECHPYLNQKKLFEFCKSKGITITAYSPLGSPGKLLTDSKIKEIGRKFKKTPAQIVLRYQVQRGIITILKSVNKDRLAGNVQIFDFELSSADMAYINSLDCNGRVNDFYEIKSHKYHPFVNDEY